ncbi:MAG: putative porin [Bacteroidota bacterium]
MRLFFVLFVLLWFSNNTFAQRFPGGGGGSTLGGGGGASTQKQVRKYSKDSLLIFYYFIENPNQEYPYQDTVLSNYFHQFDPARNRKFDYGALGYIGSPLQELVYTPKLRRGFDVGLHQYDLYKIKVDDLRFYNLKTAYSDFFFSQGGSQDDIQLKAKFSRNFAKNINVSLDYHRISQFGTNDPIGYFFQNQRARHTAIAGGMAFKNNTNTYQGFFAFSNNIHQQEDNGGIQSDSFFLNQEDGFATNLAIPVNLNNATTRHSEQEITYTQYYIFNPKQWKATKQRKAAERERKKAAEIQAKIQAARLDSLNNLPKDSLATNPNDSIPPTLVDIQNTPMDSTQNILNDSIPNIPADSIPKISTDTIQNVPIDSTQNISIDTTQNLPTDSTQNGLTDTIPNLGRDSLPNRRPPALGEIPPGILLPPDPLTPITQEGRSYTFSHRFAYNRGTYKFSDTAPVADSAYWGDFLVDTRGLRHFIEFRKIENTLAVSTFKPQRKSRYNPQSQNDFLEVGIRHAFHWIEEEAADSTVNNLFITGRWNFVPNERLKVETYAHLGIWDNAGDYRISGDLFFDLKKLGQLQLTGVNQLYSPTILQQRFYISQRNAWTNDFGPTLETSLSAAYGYPKVGFKATGAYHLLNNFIYFDTLATPQQEGAPTSIFQLILEQNFRFKKIYFDNVVTFQQTTNEVLRLPDIFSKHSIYYQGRWFKRALEIRLGTDIRINNSYFANSYNPLVGQFHLQNTQRIDFFPAFDFYASIKVKQFRFYIKMENMTRFFGNLIGDIPADEHLYQVASYPIQDNRFSFGLAWKFVD